MTQLEQSYAGPATASAIGKTGLTVFMVVVSVLFTLFLVAYVMRMQFQDWRTPPLPWQLWLSTAMLMLSSAALSWAQASARRGLSVDLKIGLLVAGILALGFVAGQWWVWHLLMAQNYIPANNPANGFFYMLTGLHGLHVLGGLLVLGGVALKCWRGAEDGPAYLQLCIRYWHCLLALWLVLFAAMAWLTPELARALCGTT